MKKIILLFFLSLFFINCSKEKDDKLNLVQQDFNGNQLRLDGYYFTEEENFEGAIYSRYAFYKNGIVRYLGSPKTLDNANFLSGNSKTVWGIFNIENDNIKFERWASGGGPFNAYMSEGKILNDTTFHITESYRLLNGEKTEFKIRNEIYHFKQFSPKPDSTNNFIR